ncbi:alpha/beta hydrolase [Ponticoccus alexandrii]|uniref:Alpha/beta fold hydrolase n=1 Tax=Ponticoccus alexandrii TaxID=1943633 RepID=A0ABX7F6Z5_9RHOB|nr:alpha/beta fold hydrolase [Ponticoccus alexandrii]QRF66288.1 alpha/beta fold hydrolase [Ponticoccus alexandrii]
MTRLALFLCCLMVLPGCAARGVMSVVPQEAGSAGVVQPVFVASNRHAAANTPNALEMLFGQDFGDSRNFRMHYARVGVSIPPTHAEGRIEWPGSAPPNPAQHFVTVEQTLYDDAPSFLAALKAAEPPGATEVVVFVHGFNVNNAEAVYRLAQIAHDFEARVPVVTYSWPSAGSPRGYVYDRDSVIFSRDGLEALLRMLTEDNRRVLLMAHSMGSQLVMETLRQISISGHRAPLERISGVALISPDIDEDVFVQQAHRIRPFPQPFALMVSRQDRALNLSSLLTGTPSRLGSIDNPARLRGLPVQVIDLSGYRGWDRSGHSTAFTAPAAIQLLKGLGVGG